MKPGLHICVVGQIHGITAQVKVYFVFHYRIVEGSPLVFILFAIVYCNLLFALRYSFLFALCALCSQLVHSTLILFVSFMIRHS